MIPAMSGNPPKWLFAFPRRTSNFYLDLLTSALIENLKVIDNGLHFSPALASWLFLAGSINLFFPNVMFDRSAPLRLARQTLKVLSPLVMFYTIWVPINYAIYSVYCGRLGLPERDREICMPFVSMAVAVIFFLFSLANGRRMHAADTGSEKPTAVVFEYLTPNPRTTRSGHVYGYYYNK